MVADFFQVEDFSFPYSVWFLGAREIFRIHSIFPKYQGSKGVDSECTFSIIT